jgi:1,4-alpha-glucan branching enzyme
MPKWVPDSEVTVDENGTPNWVDDLIMVEMRVLTATSEGTLKSATKVLDHYQEMGVNGIWLSPINDPGPVEDNPYKNTYLNLGIHTIDPNITGEDDYNKGRQVLKDFIDEAHKRNIRIFLDVISWGTSKNSPIYAEHPDWYTSKTVWGGYEFDWNNAQFVEWYKTEIVKLAVETGCDGFRYDSEPSYAGYEIHNEIRETLLSKGRKLCMMSEHAKYNVGTYDFQQSAIYNTDSYNTLPLINNTNIVDVIKNGELYNDSLDRHYQFCVSNHDFDNPGVNNNKLALGYQAIFAPFIPLWYIGDEWNNPHQSLNPTDTAMFFNKIDWEEFEKTENQKFFEDIKAMIRIRRQNPEIFANFTDSIINANICKVNASGGGLQAYARYNDDTAFVIIPNNNADGNITVDLLPEDFDMSKDGSFVVTDAYTNQVIATGSSNDIAQLNLFVSYQDMAVIKVEKTK